MTDLSVANLGTTVPQVASVSRAKELALQMSDDDMTRLLNPNSPEALTEDEALRLTYEWELWARPKQLPPPGPWRAFILKSGRATGKSRAGAEWIRKRAWEGYGPIALVGETAADVRITMMRGVTGILAISPPWFMPIYQESKRLVTWPNGIYAYTYSLQEPDQLRGPNTATVWIDELFKGQYPEEAWDNANMGLRYSDDPRAMITSTPRPTRLMRKMLKDPTMRVITETIWDNADNLPQPFLDQMKHQYEGTRLGRQELLGEVLDDVVGALWHRPMIDDLRVRYGEVPPLRQIVVGVDPSVGDREPESRETEEVGRGSECGIVVAGIGENGHGYILEDGSAMLSVTQWAKRVSDLFLKHRGQYVIVEKNQGGALHRVNLRTVNDSLPIVLVWASDGKTPRATPVHAHYEQGRVHHVGSFPDLEDQMCNYVEGEARTQPADRLDALVWALYFLMCGDDRMPHYDQGRHRVSMFRRAQHQREEAA